MLSPTPHKFQAKPAYTEARIYTKLHSLKYPKDNQMLKFLITESIFLNSLIMKKREEGDNFAFSICH